MMILLVLSADCTKTYKHELHLTGGGVVIFGCRCMYYHKGNMHNKALIHSHTYSMHISIYVHKHIYVYIVFFFYACHFVYNMNICTTFISFKTNVPIEHESVTSRTFKKL